MDIESPRASSRFPANSSGNIAFLLAVLIATGSLGGCRALQGVPDDLSADELQKLTSKDFSKVLESTRNLDTKWRQDRDRAYRWAFWSNASLIPIAAAGAGGALFSASKDFVTAFGLAGGTIVATNSFVGANDVGSAYQSGLRGLHCIYSKLAPYDSSDKKVEASGITDKIHDLAQKIADANQSLARSSALDLNSAAAQTERTHNPTIVGTLTNNEKALTQAVANAQAAISNAEAELRRFDTLASFARDRVMDVESILDARIKPRTVDYSSLVTGLGKAAPSTPLAQTPATATPLTSPAHAAHAAAAAAPGAAPPPPIEAAADDLADKQKALPEPMTNLASATTQFDLSTQETAVVSCITAL